MTTRRTFLRTSSLAAAAALGPWRFPAAGWGGLGLLSSPPRRGIRIDDPDLKALTRRALDAATAAGASYADVRVTVTKNRLFTGVNRTTPLLNPPEESEQVAVGVRALVRGAWGFMADTELTAEMMDWLGHTAAVLGRASAWPRRPPIELGERPPAAVGQWQTPVKRDPFLAPDAEHYDLLRAILDKARSIGGGTSGAIIEFNYTRQERTFASTDGAFTTQTLYTTFGNRSRLDIVAAVLPKAVSYSVPLVSPRGGGLEVFEDEHILDRIPEWVARTIEQLGAVPLQSPGRFEVVLDADAMAALVRSMGTALEIDLALGYEANAEGTSYLAPVDKVLGTTPFPAEVTVTANRTLPVGAATVRWDDEGVASQDWPLIARGELVDYATSREFVPELAGWYQKRKEAAQSRGCAGAANALSAPLVQTPNLRLLPGKKELRFEDLLAGIDDGFAVLGGDFVPDQQQFTGIGGRGALIYHVKQGKLLQPVENTRYMIRMPDLWKHLVALGGEQSAMTRGFMHEKGQPTQPMMHSVQAVPARFRDVVIRRFLAS